METLLATVACIICLFLSVAYYFYKGFRIKLSLKKMINIVFFNVDTRLLTRVCFLQFLPSNRIFQCNRI